MCELFDMPCSWACSKCVGFGTCSLHTLVHTLIYPGAYQKLFRSNLGSSKLVAFYCLSFAHGNELQKEMKGKRKFRQLDEDRADYACLMNEAEDENVYLEKMSEPNEREEAVAKWEKTTLGNGDGTGDWAEDQKIGETNAVVA